MGLDMHLNKHTYVQQWAHQADEERYSVAVMRGGQPVPGIKPERVTYIIEEVGYWRKANQIHKWFVDHVQDGNDDCGEHEVDRGQLMELLDTVNTVLGSLETVQCRVKNGETWYPDGRIEQHFVDGELVTNTAICEKLLPTQPGFFFGGVEYDSWYIQDLQNTKKILEACLAKDATDSTYYYHSSW